MRRARRPTNAASSAVHASKEIWGPDAAQYRPERWLTDDKVKKEFQERNWLVVSLKKLCLHCAGAHNAKFSAGYMSCPGRHIAMVQMSKVAALILRNFQISLADPNSPLDYQANFTALLHSWPVYMEERASIEAKQ